MPKVTEKQKIKLNQLYEKYQTNQKGKTRKQISSHWQKYRKQKYPIIEYPKYRKRYARAKDEIQEAILREKYYEKKEIKIKRVEYGDLIPTKKKKYDISQQNYFRVRKGADLDNTVSKIFADKKKNVRYVLVTLKIRLSETGQIIFVSNTYTKPKFQGLEKNVLKDTLEKLSFVAKYKGMEIISFHIRTVHDK